MSERVTKSSGTAHLSSGTNMSFSTTGGGDTLSFDGTGGVTFSWSITANPPGYLTSAGWLRCDCECIQHNLDGCTKWSFRITSQPEPGGPITLVAEGTLE
jgi:hypothetical protein